MKYLPDTVKYKQWNCVIGINHYNSDPNKPAIVLNDAEDGSPIASLTRNIHFVPDGHVAVDTNNCGTEAQKVLLDAGVIGPELKTVHSGYCNYPVYKLLITP